MKKFIEQNSKPTLANWKQVHFVLSSTLDISYQISVIYLPQWKERSLAVFSRHDPTETCVKIMQPRDVIPSCKRLQSDKTVLGFICRASACCTLFTS